MSPVSGVRFVVDNNNLSMLSEQQYYEAKVFLSAYKEALNTLE